MPQLGAALRAVRRHLELALVTGARGHHRPEHLGDHVAGLADDHGVADEHALALHLAGVVQRGQLHRRAGDLHRLHVRERRDPPGAAHVDPDVEELGGGLLRRVLEGDRPARRPRRRAQPALQRDLVDLDHHAVDLVLHRVPLLAVALDVGPHALEVVDHLEPVADREPELAQPRVGLRLPLRADPLARAEPVHDQPKRPGGGDPRVLLPERAGGGVAGVGERRLAVGHLPGVDLGERLDREVDLAAHLE